MADDLDDEWWQEDQQPAADSGPSSEEECETESKGKKRKLQDEEGDEEKSTEETEKKKRKKKKKKNITQVLASSTPEPLKPQDLITALEKSYVDKLSAMEKEELALTGDHFSECNDLSHTPSSYLKLILPDWNEMVEKTIKHPGSPVLLIICSSALRAAQLNRDVADFKGSKAKSVKLFAKHIKLQDQVKLLSKTKVHVGVGTPNRIQALIEEKALIQSKLKNVVLDWSWRDVKQRRMVDIPEIRKSLFTLLNKHLIPQAKTGQFVFGLL